MFHERLCLLQGLHSCRPSLLELQFCVSCYAAAQLLLLSQRCSYCGVMGGCLLILSHVTQLAVAFSILYCQPNYPTELWLRLNSIVAQWVDIKLFAIVLFVCSLGDMISFTLTAFVELMDHGIVSWDTFSVAFIKKVCLLQFKNIQSTYVVFAFIVLIVVSLIIIINDSFFILHFN